MRLSDSQLEQFREQGYVLVEGFLPAADLKTGQEALWSMFPKPEEFFADPGAYRGYASSQFGGLRRFPFNTWELNRLAYHPDLVDAAERLLRSRDLDLYKIELWAKYAGATDYAQDHHYDYGNHSLVVPRRDGAYLQLTSFLLLSDVGEDDAPTRLVPLPHTRDHPYLPRDQPPGAFADVEVSATGPAGSLLLYHTGVLHRATDFGAPGRSRFALLSDFQLRGHPWMGKFSWPGRALQNGWQDVLVRASVRERDLFGFPPPGSGYWNEQTLADVASRWPGIDLSEYVDKRVS